MGGKKSCRLPIPRTSLVHSKPLSVLEWLHRKDVRYGGLFENDTNDVSAGIDGS